MIELIEVIQILATSLLSAFLVYIVYIRTGRPENFDNLIKSKTTMLFLLLVLLLPIGLYFLDLIIIQWFFAYLHELIISIMIVFPVAIFYMAFAKLFQPILLSSQIERLSLIEQLDAQGEIGVALEENIISNEEAERAKMLRSLRRWIIQDNDLGWYELKEQMINKLTDMQVQWFITRELSFIQQELEEKKYIIRNDNYEEKLRSLVTEEPVGAVLEKWDNGLVSEEVAHMSLEICAFKKWVWKNDETGWFDLQYLYEDKGILSSQVIKFAEFELWEIEKRKKIGDRIDLLREKRLRSLVLA